MVGIKNIISMFKIYSRDETYSTTKHFGSFLYWEFVDGVSFWIVWVFALYVLKWCGIISFIWLISF